MANQKREVSSCEGVLRSRACRLPPKHQSHDEKQARGLADAVALANWRRIMVSSSTRVGWPDLPWLTS